MTPAELDAMEKDAVPQIAPWRAEAADLTKLREQNRILIAEVRRWQTIEGVDTATVIAELSAKVLDLTKRLAVALMEPTDKPPAYAPREVSVASGPGTVQVFTAPLHSKP